MMTSNGEPLNSADQAFIQELYYSNSKLLSICAQRMGFRAEVAEDYVQEVFLIAMKRIDVIKSCKNPQAYLIKVLRNVVGYNLRCAQYATRMIKKLQDQRSNVQVNGVYQEELDLETLYHGSINEEELRLLVRFYLEGWTSKEIAADMGINFEACKKRILRAREHLRRFLEESDQD